MPSTTRRSFLPAAWSIAALCGVFASVLLLLGMLIGVPGYVGYREIEDLRQNEKGYQGYDPTDKGVYLRGAAQASPQAQHQQPSVSRATCDSPYSREDADLCAQWAAVNAVRSGNGIAITALRSELLGTLVTTIGIILTSVGLVIAALTSRDATRAVKALEDLERGYINAEVRGADDGDVRIRLRNIGRTPLWIRSVVDRVRGVVFDECVHGLRCLPAGQSEDFIVKSFQGANPGLLKLHISLGDVLDQRRCIKVVLKLTDEVWRLAELREIHNQ